MSFSQNAQHFAISDGSFIAEDLNYNFDLRRGEDQDFRAYPAQCTWTERRPSQLERALKFSIRMLSRVLLMTPSSFSLPPNCHLGTRTQVLEILRNWVNDSTKTTPIYWLYGAAGLENLL
ncbi:hypothetical protein GYMLUDRAFT_363438 [Collybiopsis luxurians FD-317 M1]|nr:hypothetical protein GYMLUDRAFT_363438 [Collybiopsis luxurians FD-317 M1]